MKKFKKQITLVTFNRFFNPTTYLLCSSNLLLKPHIYISNYVFKSLYLYRLPKNFINSIIIDSKLVGFTNNFLRLTQFKTKKDLFSSYNSLDNLNKLKISFIKYQNLYLIGSNSSIRYLDLYFFISKLNYIFSNYMYKLFLMIKQTKNF